MEKQAVTLSFVWTARYFVVRGLGCRFAKYFFFNLQPYSLDKCSGKHFTAHIYLQLFQHNGRRSSATIANTGDTSLTRLQAEKVFQVLHVPKYNSELRIPCSTIQCRAISHQKYFQYSIFYNPILSYLYTKWLTILVPLAPRGWPRLTAPP